MNKKLKFMSFKNKKKLNKLLFSFIFSVPFIASSCSVATGAVNTSLERSISINNANGLTDNINIKKYAEIALNSQNGLNSYLKGISEDLIFNWIKKVSDNGQIQEYKDKYTQEVKKIDDEWKDKIKSYKKQYKNLYDLNLQQKELDPNGGTLKSYKQKKLNSWALTNFKNYLFAKDYLTFKKQDNKFESNPKNASQSDLYEALKSESFQFSYADRIENNSSLLDINNTNTEYANFVNYIWEKYVEINNPFVVNMSLWKYGSPKEGISNIYQGLKDTSVEQTPTNPNNPAGQPNPKTVVNNGDYKHPYFSNNSASPTTGTITKYTNFLNQAKNNGSDKIPFLMDFDKNKFGLLFIPNSYTDDGSTFIVATNGTIYNELFPEFSAASTYLFWRNSKATKINFDFNSDNSGIKSIDDDLKKDIYSNINTNSTLSLVNDSTGLDIITSEFIKSEANTTSSSSNSGSTTSATISTQNSVTTNLQSSVNELSKSKILLNKDYVNNILNSNGNASKLVNNNLNVVDAFIAKNNNLERFMFLRNQAGVHAIAIDGIDYINNVDQNNNNNNSSYNSTTLSASKKKKRAGQVLLFRTLFNNINKSTNYNNYNFSTGIKEKLESFYEQNLSWLVLSYAIEKKSEQKLFDLDFVLNKDKLNLKNIENLNNFLHQTKYYKRTYEYNDRLLKHKSEFNNNFGVNAIQNGFAAPWFFYKQSNNDNKSDIYEKYGLNSALFFNISSTVSVVNDPFDSKQSSEDLKNNDGTKYVSKKEFDKSVSEITQNLTTQKGSDFSGFKYRQQLYSNSDLINNALIDFSSASNDFSNMVKTSKLKSYVSDIFDEDKLEFKNLKNLKIQSLDLDNNKLEEHLNFALSNFFFNSVFDNLKFKWDRYNSEDNQKWKSNTNNNNISDVKKSLYEYKKLLWKKSNSILDSNSIKNYFDLYKVIASIKFLLENNAKNFLVFMKSKIKLGMNAYLVWQNSQNKNLTDKSLIKQSGKDLLKENNLNQNLNNSYFSDYLFDNSQANNQANNQTNKDGIKDNLLKTALYGEFDSSYYNIVANMIGFKGLQTSDFNSLNDLISKRLFSNLKSDNNEIGLLNSYVNRETLLNHIDTFTTMENINSLIENLANLLNQKELLLISENENLSILDKKAQLKKAIINLFKTTSDLKNIFEQRKGMLADKVSTSVIKDGLISSNDADAVQFASFIIQINNDSFSSLDKLKKSLITSVNDSDVGVTNKNYLEVFFSLIVQQSVDSNLQNKMLDSLLKSEQDKIKVYDSRLYKSLGIEWVRNWKLTN